MESTNIARQNIVDQALGNVEIIKKPELIPLEAPVVKYTIPPDIDVIGVNTPNYDCCIQKVIDEMGIYIKEHKLQFVVGNDSRLKDIIQYFPKYIIYFRSGTVPGTPPEFVQSVDSHTDYYHSLGMKVFYYLDDYLIGMNNRAPIQIMSNCDGIIVSTTTLRDAIIKEGINRPIYLLKTHVALNSFGMLTPLTDLKYSDKFNILFSSQGRIGVRQIVRLLERIEQKPELCNKIHLICLSHEVAQIRSVINKFRSTKKTYLEWLPLDMYYRLCMTVDLIVSPGEVGDLDYMMPKEVQGPWLDSKSCHKYTVAGAASIPCIASPMQDYVEGIKHGETGFIAETDDQWLEYIDLLINNVEFRREMGEKAKKDIEENWSLYDRTTEFAKIIKGEAEPYNKQIESNTKEVGSELLKSEPPVLTYIPVHNYKQYIRECLDSVISQTYPNQTVVVSDNASDDGTTEIIESEYPQVKLIKQPIYHEVANPGLDEAIKMSNCKFFTTIGADDKMSPNYWETVLPYFSDPNIGFVRVGCYTFTEDNPEGMWRKPFPFSGPKDMLVTNRILITSPCRIEAYESTTGLDPNCFFADWDLWIQIVLKGWRWATCNKPLFWYRRHGDAWSFNFDTTAGGPQYSYMRDKWMPTLLKYGIRSSAMALPEQIEEAKKESKYDKEDIKELKEVPTIDISNIGNYPEVLVYIPAHNSGKYIKECLDSVISQHYPNQTIIVSDNASTDDTVKIVEDNYKQVQLLKWNVFNPVANPGANEAIKNSNCEFFITLGSDDKLCPNFWETVLPLFDKPEIGFVRIGAYQFGDNNPSGTWWKPFAWHDAKEIFEGNKVFVASPIRKATWEDVGGFDLECVWGDWDFWMAAVLKGWKWNTYERPLFWYRRRIDQESYNDATYLGGNIEYLKKKWLPTLKKLGIKGSRIATEKELEDA